MPLMAAMVNKEMVNAAYETTLSQGLTHERRLFQILTATEDGTVKEVLPRKGESLAVDQPILSFA